MGHARAFGAAIAYNDTAPCATPTCRTLLVVKKDDGAGRDLRKAGRRAGAGRPSPDGVYIEVVTDAYAASALSLKLHGAMRALYKA